MKIQSLSKSKIGTLAILLILMLLFLDNSVVALESNFSKTEVEGAVEYALASYLLNKSPPRFVREEVQDLINFYQGTENFEKADFSVKGTYSGKPISELCQGIKGVKMPVGCTDSSECEDCYDCVNGHCQLSMGSECSDYVTCPDPQNQVCSNCQCVDKESVQPGTLDCCIYKYGTCLPCDCASANSDCNKENCQKYEQDYGKKCGNIPSIPQVCVNEICEPLRQKGYDACEKGGSALAKFCEDNLCPKQGEEGSWKEVTCLLCKALGWLGPMWCKSKVDELVRDNCEALCCTDFDPCTKDRWDKNAQQCVHTKITTCNNQKFDGCCPSGCTLQNDLDCKVQYCGNTFSDCQSCVQGGCHWCMTDQNTGDGKCTYPAIHSNPKTQAIIQQKICKSSPDGAVTDSSSCPSGPAPNNVCGDDEDGRCKYFCEEDEVKIDDYGKCSGDFKCCVKKRCDERCSDLGYPGSSCYLSLIGCGSGETFKGGCGFLSLGSCCCEGQPSPTTSTTTTTLKPCDPPNCPQPKPSCPFESGNICYYGGQAKCVEGSSPIQGSAIAGIKVCGWVCDNKDTNKQCAQSVCTNQGWDNSACGPSPNCYKDAPCQTAGETCCSNGVTYKCECTNPIQSWQPVGKAVAEKEVGIWDKCNQACKDEGYTSGYCGPLLACESGDKQLCYGCYECTWLNLGPCCCTGEKKTHLECINNVCTEVAGEGTNECSPKGSTCGKKGKAAKFEKVEYIGENKKGYIGHVVEWRVIKTDPNVHVACRVNCPGGKGDVPGYDFVVFPQDGVCTYANEGTYTIELECRLAGDPYYETYETRSVVVGGGGCPLKLDNVKAYPSPASTSATFEAEGQGIEEINVYIYNLGGSLVFNSGWKSGTSYVWDLRNNNGDLVANGVYKYKIRVRGCNDEKISSPKSITVLKGAVTTTTTPGQQCTFQPYQQCSQGCCGDVCCPGPPPTTTLGTTTTTTTTLPFTCPPWDCEDILKDPTLRAAVIKYDTNNDGKIDDNEKQKAYDDYLKYGKISKDEACAVILFNSLDCDLYACTQGGVCQNPGDTCCNNGKQYECKGTTPKPANCQEALNKAGQTACQYDANDNNKIDDAEFFKAIDDWNNGQLNDEKFFAIVTLWVQQCDLSSIC